MAAFKFPPSNGFDCLHLRLCHRLYGPAAVTLSSVWFPLKPVERWLLKCSTAAHKILHRTAWKHLQNGPQAWRSKVWLQTPHCIQDLPATYQPWSLPGGEAEREPPRETKLAKAQPHRLHYCPGIQTFIFMSFHWQLGPCSNPGCLGWVRKTQAARENLTLPRLKSAASPTCIPAGCIITRGVFWC